MGHCISEVQSAYVEGKKSFTHITNGKRNIFMGKENQKASTSLQGQF